MNLDSYRPQLHKAILEAAIGRTLPELNEPGWLAQGSSYDSVTGLDRVHVNEQARRYYHLDPTLRHMVQLRNSYTFGRGVVMRAVDDEVNKYLQEAFWNHPLNRDQISRSAAQYRLNRDMQLDGEIFFMLLTSRVTGRVIVRCIHPSRIKLVIYKNGDAIAYKYTMATGNGGSEDVIVPDWRFDGDDRAQAQVRPFFGGNTNVAMMHVIGNEFVGADNQRRGISPLSTSIPWVKALKGFMEDRATLMLARSTFAFMVSVKGNRQAVERVRTQFNQYEPGEQRYPQVDGRERRQGANTMIKNQALDYEAVQTPQDARNAYEDMRMLRQQAGIGQGVFEPFMGDAGNANLATATAMNLPMRKQYEFEQQLWQDVFTDLGTYALTQGFRFRPDLMRDNGRSWGVYRLDQSNGYPQQTIVGNDDVDLDIDVLFPPIVEADVATYSQALQNIATAEATTGRMILPPEAKAQIALRTFGFQRDMNRYMQMLEDNDFMPENTPEPTLPDPNEQEQPDTEETGEAVSEADIGKPLPKNEAEKVGRVTKSEMDKAFDDFANLPSLDEYAKQLGFDSAEDLDNA